MPSGRGGCLLTADPEISYNAISKGVGRIHKTREFKKRVAPPIRKTLRVILSISCNFFPFFEARKKYKFLEFAQISFLPVKMN